MLEPFKSTFELFTQFTYSIRKWILRSVLIMGVFAGIVLLKMPFEWRVVFGYVFIITTTLGFYSEANVYASSVRPILSMAFFGKKFKMIPYTSASIQRLKEMMNLPNVKVFLTNNPAIKSPFTNGLTSKVY